jgi:hypothetical protein
MGKISRKYETGPPGGILLRTQLKTKELILSWNGFGGVEDLSHS